MSPAIFVTILEKAASIEDVHRAVAVLRPFFERIFFSDAPQQFSDELLEVYLQESETEDHIKNMIRSLDRNALATITRDNLYQTCDDVLKNIDSHPHVTLYIPKALTFEDTIKIRDWFRKNTSVGDILLDLKIDPATVGGCAFVWNGTYHDFSLSYFIGKSQNDILTMIHGYQKETDTSHAAN